MAESVEHCVQSVWVSGSEPLQQESSLPLLQEDSDDDLPELLEADSDTDSEGVPELVADLSGVTDYDDMPELGSDSDDDVSDDDDDEPPPLVGEDSDDEDDLPELIAFKDEEDSEKKCEVWIVSGGAYRSHAYRSQTQQPCWAGKGAIGNLEGFGVSGVTWNESRNACDVASVLYQSQAGRPLVITDPFFVKESAPSEVLGRPVDCPKLGDQGLVKGEERPVVRPMEAKQAEPQEWSTGLFDCCLDVPTCLLGALCPCVLYGKTHRLATGRSYVASALAHFFAVLGGACLGGCFLCHWGYAPCAAAPLRSVIRGKYGLAATGPFELASEAEGRLADCFVHYWCHPCALCQEYREVKFRTALKTGGTYTAPPVVEEMEKRVVMEPVKSAGAKEEAGGVYYTLLAGE